MSIIKIITISMFMNWCPRPALCLLLVSHVPVKEVNVGAAAAAAVVVLVVRWEAGHCSCDAVAGCCWLLWLSIHITWLWQDSQQGQLVSSLLGLARDNCRAWVLELGELEWREKLCREWVGSWEAKIHQNKWVERVIVLSVRSHIEAG